MRRLGHATLAMLALLPLALAADPAAADDTVQWKDIVGIVQAKNVVGAGLGQVTGGAQPWTTAGGLANVDLATGQVHFVVKGLVFAGGNAVGRPGAVTEVKGTLLCDTDGSAAPDTQVVDTALVPLSSRGDAEFTGPVGPIPGVCFSEPDIAFLIRTGGGAWIANGAILSR